MSEAGDPGLWDCYVRTSYCARTPQGLIRLRVGSASGQLDRLLADHGMRDWAFVSACNPGSKPLPDALNGRRHEELVRTVRSLGRPFFAGDGVPDDGRWKAEHSLLILGIAEEPAARLGGTFGQNAVVVGTLGGVPRLKACSNGS